MRRILVAGLFLAGACLALSSCNNGDYDADPKSNLSKVKNPLDPNSGVTVYIGSIEAVINHEKVLFVNGVHYNQFDEPSQKDIKYIVAEAQRDNILYRRFQISVPLEFYEGPKTYIIGGDAFAWTFMYLEADTSVTDRLVHHKYIAGANGKGTITFNLKGQEDDNLRGTFSGTAYRAILKEDKVTPSGEFDMNDSVVINKAEFYVPLRK